jgi:hypothetical protein
MKGLGFVCQIKKRKFSHLILLNGSQTQRRPSVLPQAGRDRSGETVREARWALRDLRLVRAPGRASARVRRVQLRTQRRKVLALRIRRVCRRILLQGVRPAGEGQRWLSPHSKSRLSKD